MLTAEEVLAALGERLSPGDLADAVRRLLRVPETWRELSEAEFLERALNTLKPSELDPGHVALLRVGIAPPPNMRIEQDGRLQSEVEEMWTAAHDGDGSVQTLEDVGLLTIACIWKAAETGGARKIENDLLQNPELWQGPLACAWSYLPGRNEILARLTKDPSNAPIGALATILLANETPSEAARIFLSVAGAPSGPQLLQLLELGEAELAKHLVEEYSRGGALQSQNEASVEEQLVLAAAAQVRGEQELSQRAIDQAWEAASRQMCQVALQMARQARIEGNAVVEAEALKHALAQNPSRETEAELAIALLEAGRTEEASALLPSQSDAVAARIAIGLVQIGQGLGEEGRETLRSSLKLARKLPSWSVWKWIAPLEQGFEITGDLEGMLETAELRVAMAPSDPNARVRFALIALQAGYAKLASHEAQVALALRPGDPEARRTLARSLDASGAHQKALPHWQALVGANASERLTLGYSALHAGDHQLAEACAAELLSREPGSIPARILESRSLAHRGETKQALDRLLEAAEEAPQSSEVWTALANALVDGGEHDKALATLDAAIQVVPDKAALHGVRGELLQDLGRFTEAHSSIRAAHQAEPDEPRWLAESGQLLCKLGHTEEAVPYLERAVMRQPGNWEPRFALARILEQKGRFADADSLLSAFKTQIPDSCRLAAGKIAVEAYRAEGSAEALGRGVRYLKELAEQGEDSPELHFWYGMALKGQGRSEESLREFELCLREPGALGAEEYRAAVVSFAKTASESGQAALALSVLEEACARHPESVEIAHLLSRTYLEAKLPDKAVAVAEEAATRHPEEVRLVLQLGRAAGEANQPSKAKQAFARVVDLAPEDEALWFEFAEALLDAGEETEARDAVAKALWLDRRNVSQHPRAARICGRLGEWSKARRLLARSSEREPTNTALLQELAQMSEDAGDLPGAEEAWRKAHELDPGNPVPLGSIARLCWAMDRRAEAIGFWQQAISIAPQDTALQVSLARAYLANGEEERGLRQFAEALELLPDDQDLADEAAQAALEAGRPDIALRTLERILRAAADEPMPYLRLGETLLALGRFQDARGAFDRAARSLALPPRSKAQYAITHVEEGDLVQATATLDETEDSNLRDLEDARWLAKACVRLCLWDRAARIIRVAPDLKDGTARARVDLIESILRVQDALWLFKAAGATRHAPSLDAGWSEVAKRLIEGLAGGGAAGPENGEVLRLWQSVVLNPEDAESRRALNQRRDSAPYASAHDSLAIAMLRCGESREAALVLKGKLEADRGTGWSAILYGLARIASEDISGAIETLQSNTIGPEMRPIALALLAEAFRADSQYDLAISSLNGALALWPDEPEWHHRVGRLYVEGNRLDTALPHLQTAVELDPGSALYRRTLANAHWDLGNESEAKLAFENALQLDPTNASTWYRAGEFGLATDDPRFAYGCFERACELLPEEPKSQLGALRASLAQGDHRLAAKHAEAAQRLAPDDPDVLIGVSELFASRGNAAKALEALAHAQRHAEDAAPIHASRGRILLDAGKVEEALTELETALECAPEDQSTLAALATAYLARGEQDEALRAADRCVRLSGGSAESRLLLAGICRKTGHLDRALEVLSLLEADFPDTWRAAYERGRVHEDRREIQLALESYQRAIELRPDRSESHFRAGVILKSQKEYGLAGRMLSRAAELSPNDPDILHQLAAVRALQIVHGGIPRTVKAT